MPHSPFGGNTESRCHVGNSSKYHGYREKRNARDLNRIEPIYLTVSVTAIICGYRSVVVVSTYSMQRVL